MEEKIYGEKKKFDGLFRYHHQEVIHRPASALRKTMLIEHRDNGGHRNYR